MNVYVVHAVAKPTPIRRGFRTKRDAQSYAAKVSGVVFRYELPHMSVKAAWNVGTQGLEDALCTSVERLQ